MLAILAVALGVGTIVGIHEACHMLMAKFFDVKVLRFSLGFGPILLSKQIGETSYELRLLPLGGFVQFHGETPEEDVVRGFFSLPWWKRALIALAGPAANLVLGFLILCAILVFGRGWAAFSAIIRAIQIVLFMATSSFQLVFGHTPNTALATTAVHTTSGSVLSGPIMITKILIDSFKEGAVSFFLILSYISESLGFFNLLPVPALDGGHVFLYIIEGIRRKKLSSNVYVVWNLIGYALLIGITIYTCFGDIFTLTHH